MLVFRYIQFPCICCIINLFWLMSSLNMYM
jgi:hypothetical protein